MNLRYVKTQVHMLGDEPAYKAGEWPGIKPNKFSRMKCIIQPKRDYSLTNLPSDYQSEMYRTMRRQVPQRDTPEYEFRPCLKLVTHKIDSTSEKEAKISTFHNIFEKSKGLMIKSNYFQQRNDYLNKLQEKEKFSENKNIIKDELNFLAKMGIYTTEEELYKINSEKFKKKVTSDKGKFNDLSWQKQELEKLMNYKIAQDNMKRDVNYVKTLNDWDKRFVSVKDNKHDY